MANVASKVEATWGRLVGVVVGGKVWVGVGVGVAVLPMVELGPGVFVFTIVGDAVGGSAVVVGTVAANARVGRVAWALVAVELCQKKMPVLMMTSKTTMMKTIRKTGRDEFTVKVPIRIIIFRQRGVRCG
jgi:hypothetical protein